MGSEQKAMMFKILNRSLNGKNAIAGSARILAGSVACKAA